MARRLFQLSVVATLVFVVGVHWIILQSVAWTGMIIVYAQTAPLRDAIVKTFDGNHPCRLCKAVQEGKKAEQEQRPRRTLTTKIDFFFEHSSLRIAPPSLASLDFLRIHLPSAMNHRPPTPPPREFLG